VAVYATVEDVELEYDGTIPPSQIDWVDNKLTSAEVILLNTVRDLPARIDAGTVTIDAVRIVLCNMVIRLLNNPKGIRTQSAGPFSYTLGREVSVGHLYMTNSDKRLLGLPRAQSIALNDAGIPFVIRRWHDYMRDDILP
jgi:hypothetical protein